MLLKRLLWVRVFLWVRLNQAGAQQLHLQAPFILCMMKISVLSIAVRFPQDGKIYEEAASPLFLEEYFLEPK